MKTFLKLIRLRPHGDKLTDGVVDIWLIFATLSIAAVAVCDSVAWAYLGYTTASGWTAWASMAALGLVAFILVGSLDASFVMQDTTSDKSVTASSGTPAGTMSTLQWLRAHVRRNHLAVAVRIVLVILSFTVTAPFLTQFFFSRDIAAAIERGNAQSVSVRRAEIAARHDQQLTALRGRAEARRKDLEAEVAGKGRSSRFGDGPAAAAIRTDVASLEQEIAATENSRAQELNDFDAASPEVRARKWGVDLQREGPDTRARVVAEMETSPAFRATRNTIKAFLAFLFLGLVSLKLFQPPSVKVYFNAELQAAYRRLEAGLFDGQLDPREHAGVGMAPLHFAKWYEERQSLREATQAIRDRASEIMERLKVQEEAYTAVQKKLVADISGMHEDLTDATNNTTTFEQELAKARTEQSALAAAVHEQEQELNDFAQLGDDLPLRERRFLIDGRMKAAKLLSSNRLQLNELNATVSRLAAQFESSRAYTRTITLSLDQAARDLVDVNRLIADARQKMLHDLT